MTPLVPEEWEALVLSARVGLAAQPGQPTASFNEFASRLWESLCDPLFGFSVAEESLEPLDDEVGWLLPAGRLPLPRR